MLFLLIFNNYFLAYNKSHFLYNEFRVGWVIALYRESEAGRKVRAGQGTVVANGHPGQPAGKCSRKYTADDLYGTGNGEMVR